MSLSLNLEPINELHRQIQNTLKKNGEALQKKLNMNIICLFLGHDMVNLQCQRCGKRPMMPEGHYEDQERALVKIKDPLYDAILFPVPGAGYIAISPDAHDRTGQSVGFHFCVSWGEHGYCGGVLGRTQAKRLAEHILKICDGIEETEIDEWFRRDQEMRDRYNELNKTV